jgi:hypothetical protein
MSFFNKNSLAHRILSAFIAFSFTFGVILPPGARAQSMPSTVLNLPVPGSVVITTPNFLPATIKGINLYPDNPLKFDFIIDKGDMNFSDEDFKKESTKLIKYFLASLTVPEDQMWVNLSPYEKNRIVPDDFGKTEMGRDLLAQDYMLKQLTASLMNPEADLGGEFWKRVYAKAKEKYGTTDIPMNTFNKIWIVPQKAVVYEHEKGAFVVRSHLKVMLEEDYLALEANKNSNKHGLGDLKKEDLKVVSGVQTSIIKDLLIPEIEKEVNEGKTFANLRQIYNSVILASWYKQALRESLLGQYYVDQKKTKGIETDDQTINEKIYNQYVESFKKGVYNYIKEDYDPKTQEVIPRKYFSGGANLAVQKTLEVENTAIDFAALTKSPQNVSVDLASLTSNQPDRAMRGRTGKSSEDAVKLRRLQLLSEETFSQHPPVPLTGIRGLKKADAILKEKNAIGFIVGPTGQALWNEKTTEEELTNLKGIDIIVLTEGFDIGKFRGGINWWRLVTESIPTESGAQTEQLFINSNNVFLRADLSFKTPLRDLEGKPLKPGLYLSSKEFNIELSARAAQIGADENLQINGDNLQDLRDKLAQKMGDTPSLWTQHFGSSSIVGGDISRFVLEVNPFDRNLFTALILGQKYQDVASKRYLQPKYTERRDITKYVAISKLENYLLGRDRFGKARIRLSGDGIFYIIDVSDRDIQKDLRIEPKDLPRVVESLNIRRRQLSQKGFVRTSQSPTAEDQTKVTSSIRQRLAEKGPGGWKGYTIADIARELKEPRASLYSHFRNHPDEYIYYGVVNKGPAAARQIASVKKSNEDKAMLKNINDFKSQEDLADHLIKMVNGQVVTASDGVSYQLKAEPISRGKDLDDPESEDMAVEVYLDQDDKESINPVLKMGLSDDLETITISNINTETVHWQDGTTQNLQGLKLSSRLLEILEIAIPSQATVRALIVNPTTLEYLKTYYYIDEHGDVRKREGNLLVVSPGTVASRENINLETVMAETLMGHLFENFGKLTELRNIYLGQRMKRNVGAFKDFLGHEEDELIVYYRKNATADAAMPAAQRLEQVVNVNLSLQQEPEIRHLQSLRQQMFLPVPANAARGLNGLIKANTILESRGAIGIIVGSTAQSLWQGEATEEDLKNHHDIDVVVLNKNFTLNDKFEAGIDWWLPKTIDLKGTSQTIYVNGHNFFLKAGLKFPAVILKGGKPLPPGLYLPSREFLIDLTESVVLAGVDLKASPINSEKREDFHQILSEELDSIVAPLWKTNFHGIERIFGFYNNLDPLAIRVEDFDFSKVQQIIGTTIYRDVGQRPYQDSLKNAEEKSPDAAMGSSAGSVKRLADSQQALNANRYTLDANKGGIDLNPTMLNTEIKRTGRGVIIPTLKGPMPDLKNLEGFVPNIINISPIKNLPLLLGVTPILPVKSTDSAQIKSIELGYIREELSK